MVLINILRSVSKIPQKFRRVNVHGPSAFPPCTFKIPRGTEVPRMKTKGNQGAPRDSLGAGIPWASRGIRGDSLGITKALISPPNFSLCTPRHQGITEGTKALPRAPKPRAYQGHTEGTEEAVQKPREAEGGR